MTGKTVKRPHEPLFHVVKREELSGFKSVAVRAAAILAAIIVSSLVVLLAEKVNPIGYFSSMIKGAFSTSTLFWDFIHSAALLLIVAVALTPAFKMRFWNIGGEGQVLVGGLAATACMFYLGGKIPDPLLWVLMLVSGLLAGALWALLPALCKAKWNTNETLFTLMMNYIAIQLVKFFLDTWVTSGSGVLEPMHSFGFPQIGNKWLSNIIIVLIITAFMYVYLKYSKHGYEISVVGESENTARYIGINVKRVIIRTVIISGLLCGLAGVLICGGINHTISTTTAKGRGFTAILVSWLAKFNPLYMVLTSLLIVFFQVGALQVKSDYNVSDVSDITTAIILFFIVGCEFFIRYKVMFKHHHKEDEANG